MRNQLGALGGFQARFLLGGLRTDFDSCFVALTGIRAQTVPLFIKCRHNRGNLFGKLLAFGSVCSGMRREGSTTAGPRGELALWLLPSPLRTPE